MMTLTTTTLLDRLTRGAIALATGLITFLPLTDAHAQAPSAADGLRLIEVERFNDAGRAFRQIAAQPNVTADQLYYAGYYYLTQNQPDSAQMLFDRGRQVNAKHPLPLVGQGTVALVRNDANTARARFDEAKKLSRNRNAEVFYRIGEAWTVFAKDAGEAIPHLNKAIELDRTRPEYLVMLGDAYLIPNDGSAAATNYDRARRLNPNYTKAYIRYGKTLERARSFTEALKSYKEGMARDSSYTPGFRELGELYYRAGKYPEAVANYRKYIERTDGSDQAMLNYAGFLYLTRNYAEAAPIIERLRGRYETPVFYRLAAYDRFELGEYEQAQRDMDRLMGLLTDTVKTPYLASDYEYLGKLKMTVGRDTARGLALMRRAAERDSNRAASIKELGDSAFARRQYMASARFYETYLTVKSTAPVNDYFRLGQSYYFGRSYRAADSAFAIVTQRAPNSPTGILYRGYCNIALDPKYERGLAKPHFEEYLAFTSDPSKVTDEQRASFAKSRAVAHAYLATFNLAKQDATKARTHANEALKEDPGNSQAKQVLAQLKQTAGK